MNPTFDRNLFTQIGLDSSSLTMLGTIVHSFSQPGEYRGVVHQGEQVKAVFTISSDNNSASAQAAIDLASLVEASKDSHQQDCSCCQGSSRKPAHNEFAINPRGYVLFHVSQGSGGYYVHVRRTDAEKEDKGYDSRSLAEGDVFTAIVLRPGIYSILNTQTRAKGELTVRYPERRDKKYRIPAPVRIACNQKSFDPNKLQIDPGQGLIFESRIASRIQITLEKPNDGPKSTTRPSGRIASKLA